MSLAPHDRLRFRPALSCAVLSASHPGPGVSGVAGRQDRPLAALAAMALGVAFFTCIDTSAKWLMEAGMPPLLVVLARYAGHFTVALAIFLPLEGLRAFRSARPGLQAARALCLVASTGLNFLALGALPLTVATTIMFAGPVVVTLLAIPILGERVGLHRIGAVLAGFGGVVIVMQPWGAAFHPAMFYNLCGLVFAALYFILTRQLAGTDANSTMQLWGSGVPVLALAPLMLMPAAFGPAPLPLSGPVLAVLALIGVFGALGHILATLAHRLADASALAPVSYLQLLWATMAGALVWGTWPTANTLAGGAVIAAAGLYIVRRERLRRAGR